MSLTWDEIVEQIESQEIVLSFSSLKHFAECPEHFMRYKMKEFVPSPDMVFGQLGHTLILESEEVAMERFFIGGRLPSSDNQAHFANHVLKAVKQRGKNAEGEYVVTEGDYEAAFAAAYSGGSLKKTIGAMEPYIKATLAGKQCVSMEDFEHAKWLKQRALKNPAAARLFEETVQTEMRVNWTSYNGWKLTGFLDAESDHEVPNSFINDLKFTNAEPDKAGRQIFNMKYFVQMAMYKQAKLMEGKEFRDAFITCIQPKTGDVSVNLISEDYLHYGLQTYKLWLQDFNRVMLTKKWAANYEFYGMPKGEYKGVHMCNKPNWAPGLKPIFDDPSNL